MLPAEQMAHQSNYHNSEDHSSRTDAGSGTAAAAAVASSANNSFARQTSASSEVDHLTCYMWQDSSTSPKPDLQSALGGQQQPQAQVLRPGQAVNVSSHRGAGVLPAVAQPEAVAVPAGGVLSQPHIIPAQGGEMMNHGQHQQELQFLQQQFQGVGVLQQPQYFPLPQQQYNQQPQQYQQQYQKPERPPLVSTAPDGLRVMSTSGHDPAATVYHVAAAQAQLQAANVAAGHQQQDGQQPPACSYLPAYYTGADGAAQAVAPYAMPQQHYHHPCINQMMVMNQATAQAQQQQQMQNVQQMQLQMNAPYPPFVYDPNQTPTPAEDALVAAQEHAVQAQKPAQQHQHTAVPVMSASSGDGVEQVHQHNRGHHYQQRDVQRGSPSSTATAEAPVGEHNKGRGSDVQQVARTFSTPTPSSPSTQQHSQLLPQPKTPPPDHPPSPVNLLSAGVKVDLDREGGKERTSSTKKTSEQVAAATAAASSYTTATHGAQRKKASTDTTHAAIFRPNGSETAVVENNASSELEFVASSVSSSSSQTTQQVAAPGRQRGLVQGQMRTVNHDAAAAGTDQDAGHGQELRQPRHTNESDLFEEQKALTVDLEIADNEDDTSSSLEMNRTLSQATIASSSQPVLTSEQAQSQNFYSASSEVTSRASAISSTSPRGAASSSQKSRKSRRGEGEKVYDSQTETRLQARSIGSGHGRQHEHEGAGSSASSKNAPVPAPAKAKAAGVVDHMRQNLYVPPHARSSAGPSSVEVADITSRKSTAAEKSETTPLVAKKKQKKSGAGSRSVGDGASSSVASSSNSGAGAPRTGLFAAAPASSTAHSSEYNHQELVDLVREVTTGTSAAPHESAVVGPSHYPHHHYYYQQQVAAQATGAGQNPWHAYNNHLAHLAAQAQPHGYNPQLHAIEQGTSTGNIHGVFHHTNHQSPVVDPWTERNPALAEQVLYPELKNEMLEYTKHWCVVFRAENRQRGRPLWTIPDLPRWLSGDTSSQCPQELARNPHHGVNPNGFNPDEWELHIPPRDLADSQWWVRFRRPRGGAGRGPLPTAYGHQHVVGQEQLHDQYLRYHHGTALAAPEGVRALQPMLQATTEVVVGDPAIELS
ncbi:unnamed protein product [Amoebophrya sp. A120]|nr:unnamed protein product [Amoebophrya sp. A120]|eukprot:GSA120T00010040001.1